MRFKTEYSDISGMTLDDYKASIHGPDFMGTLKLEEARRKSSAAIVAELCIMAGLWCIVTAVVLVLHVMGFVGTW